MLRVVVLSSGSSLRLSRRGGTDSCLLPILGEVRFGPPNPGAWPKFLKQGLSVSFQLFRHL